MRLASGAWRLLRETFRDWVADDVPQHGAALAFYAAFSLAPLLVIALSVAAMFFGEDAARGEVERQMHSLIGEQGSRAIQDMIINARRPVTGTWATVLSVGLLVFGASGVFGQLQSSLNAIWKVHSPQSRGWVRLIRDRFLSFAMVLCIAFLLLVSLVISAVMASLGTWVERMPDRWEGWFTGTSHFAISFFVITLLFAAIFKILPDARIRWRDVWLGAAVTSMLFTVGKMLIGWYLGYSSFASSYGLAGSFVVLLFWVYYSSQILYLGAEVTQVYAKLVGSPIVRRAAESSAKVSPPAGQAPPRAD